MQVRRTLAGLKIMQDKSVGSQHRYSWLKVVVVLMLVLGVFFRFVNLDRKVYWTDETYTSLRISGYTEAEFVRKVFNGKVIRVEEMQRYQHPAQEKGWGDAFTAFSGNAEHSPLYFVLARFWAQTVGSSVGAIRCLSALISLLAFPSLYWLCQELFASVAVSGVALAIVAIAPLHVLYAQEARQYSLWTVATLLSSAALLRAMRIQTRRSWGIYAATIALGLYSHLLFGLVAAAHVLYVAVLEKFRFSKTAVNFLLSSMVGLLAFSPWLAIALLNLNRIQTTTASLTVVNSRDHMLDRWFMNLNMVFVNRDLGTANLILVLLAAYALYFLCRTAPRRVWLFVLLLVGVTALTLAVPDVVMGGQRSLRVRYLISTYLGIQLAIAYLLAILVTQKRGWQQKLGSLGLGLLLAMGVWGCAASAQAEVWWNKSMVRSGYYPAVARILNRADRPLVISDSPPIDVLAFSHQLKPNIHFQLATVPGKIRVARGFDRIFLFNPSTRLRNRLVKTLGYRATPVYRDRSAIRLWRLDRPKQEARR
jgi:uncharacterized membrane protein